MGILTRSDIPYGLKSGVKTLLYKSIEGISPQWSSIAMEIASTKASEDYAWLGDVPAVREFTGERQVKALKEYGFNLVNKTWESTLGIGRATIEDEQYGQIRPRIASLAEAAMRHQDQIVFELVHNGFSGLSYDGIAFFGAHATGTNLGSSTLSATTVQDTREAARKFKTANGQFLNVNLDTLIVPPELEGQALELAKSPVVVSVIPSTASSVTNYSNILQGTLNVIVTPYLTEANHWAMIDSSKSVKPFIFQNRMPIELESLDNPNNNEVAFMRDEYLFGVRARYAAGYGMHELAFGHNP